MAIGISSSPANTFPTPAADAATATTKASDAKTLNQNFDQFLTLLTVQLKNQDPLSPMDSTQFTNQLVSFSGVEQQIKTNDNLSKLVSLTNASQTTLGLSYIGLNVDMEGSQFKYTSGNAKMSYTLPSDAATNTLNIIDANGNTVYTHKGDAAKGKHEFVWDGKNNDGLPVAAGTYKFLVGAVDQEHKSITATTIVPGRVEGIQTAEDHSILLLINDQQVPMSSISKATL